MSYVDVSIGNELNLNLNLMCREIEDNIKNNKILYTENLKNKVGIRSLTYNLINFRFNNSIQENLRKILITEAFSLESNYPEVGDAFLKMFLSYHKNKQKYNDINEYISVCCNKIKKIERKSKKDIFEKIKEIKNKKSKQVCREIIKLSSHDTKIFLENTSQKNIFLKKTDKINFSLEFDERFLINSAWHADNFYFIVIDGFIQEVSEIHHLLTMASEDKKKYVIFCKGASEDVKNTILYNLQRGTINVFPICLKINEENVNILNDVAACLGSDIVSALKGDTISSSVRRKLDTAEYIYINNSGFTLSINSLKRVKNQKNFLKSKLESINNDDPNFAYISKRIKNLESNKLSIKINRKEMNEVYEDIDKFLKFLQLGKSGIAKFKIDGIERKIYSVEELIILFKKLKSVVNKIEELGCAVTLEQ